MGARELADRCPWSAAVLDNIFIIIIIVIVVVAIYRTVVQRFL